MSSIRTRLADLAELTAFLPKLLEKLSIARGQIIVDQLRSAIDDGKGDAIVIVEAIDEAAGCEARIAAAILIDHVKGATEPPNDSATMLHAGWIDSHQNGHPPEAIRSLRTLLNQTLVQRGVHFVQWATDADDYSEAAETWSEGLGFEWAADLDYMTVDLNGSKIAPLANIPETLSFRPLQWEGGNLARPDQFASLVQQTYVDTLDCPALLKYRTAAETLRNYQQSAAFAPQLWFEILRKSDAIDRERGAASVGVLIMGLHGGEDEADAPPNGNPNAAVTELVYMGIVADVRGESFGSQVMQFALQTSHQFGADRMILAVDQQNHYARRLYEACGMRCMLNESVAVKKL
ncbi:GNAT family N-acetyltransferase [Novipirellula artificiosorum]|uniref:GNAT family N-acetyltransferase n=1 Tax=Novipirellula artificiosorum TaxID=2528016 RepID=UPI0011B71C56|nr:GNAT family N-acetyltransferase [Novipirellula artificiosorum]